MKMSCILYNMYMHPVRSDELQCYLSISVSSMLTSCPPFSLVSKMASHSSKNRMASLILASLNMNLKFSPALMLPKEGKLISNTYNVRSTTQIKTEIGPQAWGCGCGEEEVSGRMSGSPLKVHVYVRHHMSLVSTFVNLTFCNQQLNYACTMYIMTVYAPLPPLTNTHTHT